MERSGGRLARLVPLQDASACLCVIVSVGSGSRGHLAMLPAPPTHICECAETSEGVNAGKQALQDISTCHCMIDCKTPFFSA